MTIALQRNGSNSDTILFDAVLSYNQSYTSSLTKHPVDSSSDISDNIVTENPTLTLKGVISNADFNTNRPADAKFINNQPVSDVVQIKVDDSILNTVSGSFGFGKNPELRVDMVDRSYNPAQMAKALLLDIREKRETCTLIEYTNGAVSNAESDLVITSLQFSEDPNTGDALSVDMTLQKAIFAKLESTSLNLIGKKSAIPDKSARQVNYGNQATPVHTTLLQDAVGKFEGTFDSIKNTDGYSTKKAIEAIKAGWKWIAE